MDWSKVKKHEKKIGALAIVFSMISILALPLYWYYIDNESPDMGASTSYLVEFSEIIRPTSDVSVNWDTVYPASPTTHFDKVDEVTSDSATTYVGTATPSDIDIFDMTNMSNEDRGEYTEIDAVTLWAYAAKTASGTANFQMGVRISSTNYVGVSTTTLLTSYTNFTHTYDVNPATSAAWTITEVNALQTYITTSDATPPIVCTQLALIVPGRQVMWPPTFTSTPDTSTFADSLYSYTSTTNETSIFSLHDWNFNGYSSGSTSFVLRPNSDISGDNVMDYPDTGANVYYDKLDEVTVGSDTDTTYVRTLSSSSAASCYVGWTDIDWSPYGAITDIDLGIWVWQRCNVGNTVLTRDGIQPDPGNTGSNANFYNAYLGDAWLNSTYQWEINPYTTAEWTSSQINAMRAYVSTADTSDYGFWSQFGLRVNFTYEVAPWFTFTPANATLWGTPDSTDIGSWYISIQADSATGEGSAWQNFTITVGEPWAPTFTSTPIESAVVGFEYNYSVTLNESFTFGSVSIVQPVGGSTNAWLNDTTPDAYKYNDASGTTAYVSGNGETVWSLDRFVFYRLDLSSLPDDAELDEMTVDIYRSYGTATGPQAINVSGAWGGTSGSYSGVWDEAYLKTLLPAGSLAFDGTPVDAGWNSWTGNATKWQTQFETNKTIYIVLTGWDFLTEGVSYGWNASTTLFSFEYSTASLPAGTDWLHWDDDGFLWGTPAEADVGYTWTVSIPATSDTGSLTTWQNFTVSVGNGWGPDFTSTPTATGATDVLYSYTATCNETVDWPVDDDFETNTTFLYWGEANHTVYGTPTPTDDGTYFVHIFATSIIGHLVTWQNYTLVISLTDNPPVANAGPDQYIIIGSLVYFNGSGSTDDYGITNYTWALMDVVDPPYFVYGVSPSYLFVSTGDHLVTLNVKDSSDQIDTDDVIIHVTNTAAPVANAGPDQSVYLNATVTFSGALSTDDVGVTNYTWSFTYSGSTEFLFGVSPTFVFAIAGNYTVTLEVFDVEAQTDTDTMVVHVSAVVTPPVDDHALDATLSIMGYLALIGIIGMIASPPLLMLVAGREDGEGKLWYFLLLVVFEGVFFVLFYMGIVTIDDFGGM